MHFFKVPVGIAEVPPIKCPYYYHFRRIAYLSQRERE